MDEPWELPASRRDEWVAWIRRLRALPVLEGKEMLVWGDVPAVHPELCAELPASVTVCEWGYEDNHPFAERTARLAEAGVPFWVCPGTSSWLSLGGRVDNMIGNIAAAARAGAADGASGILVTDWGDMGHLQQPPVSDPGLAAAAAFGWCADAHADLDGDALGAMLDAQAAGRTDDLAAGAVVVALGRACRMVEPRPPNMSALALPLLLPQWPVGRAMTKGMMADDLGAVEAMTADVTASLAGHRMRRADAALVHDELVATAELLRLACHDARARPSAVTARSPPWTTLPAPGSAASSTPTWLATAPCGRRVFAPAVWTTVRPGSSTWAPATEAATPNSPGSGPSAEAAKCPAPTAHPEFGQVAPVEWTHNTGVDEESC